MPKSKFNDGAPEPFEIAPAVERAAVDTDEPTVGDPTARRLRIFALDPTTSRLDGSQATVSIPFEPLKRGGIRGRLFAVEAYDASAGLMIDGPDVDDPPFLLDDGRQPAAADPLFRRQMVYAVASLVHRAFRRALGRDLTWGFECGVDATGRPLLLRPEAGQLANAYYDKSLGVVAFGYFPATTATGRNVAGGHVYTSLSHDIVAHEVTHALLDGLRSGFLVPGGGDVLAFHEALADLVAVFLHFSYPAVVEAALATAGADVARADLLTHIARQFAQTTDSGRVPGMALRTAIEPPGRPKLLYRAESEAHELGSVLVSAVFSAFATVFARKTERYVRLAAGSGASPGSPLPPQLLTILAGQASQLASQFLNLTIRAIDYCPPVDVQLGEFLRAMVTADRELVPDDPWGYREAWVDGFWQREIYPPGVGFLSEDALVWRAPERPIARIRKLSFAMLRFAGDPARPASRAELRRQARALGQVATRPENLALFGLAASGDPALRGDQVTVPCVQSVRTVRRVGPDGQVLFDLVAEITQCRDVPLDTSGMTFPFLGGATVIIGPDGKIRYVIGKGITSEERLARQKSFVAKTRASLWQDADRGLRPRGDLLRFIHDAAGAPRGGAGSGPSAPAGEGP